MSLLKLLSSDGFISVNKTLIKKLGLEHAVIIGELSSEYEYYRTKNQLTEDGYFFSTMKNIEDKTSIKEKRQRAVINELEDLGILNTVKRGLPSKRYIKINQTELFKVISEDNNLLSTIGVSSSASEAELGRSVEATNNNIINNKIINNNNTLPQQVEAIDWEDLFDQFYSMYPKKVNKKKAFDKFKLKYKKHGLDTIMKGTASYAKVMELNNQDKQYIKGPDVFLNGEHYLDDHSELLKKKPNQQMAYKPWEEEFNNGYTTNSYANENNRTELPGTTKQIGW